MKRQRLTITMENELVSALDQMIDGDALRNRSQTIEYLLKEGLGLHQLKQAFVFVEEGYNQENIEQFLTLCRQAGVSQLYLVVPSQLAALNSDLSTLIYAHAGDFISLQVVPGDFGSGGGIVMQKDQLKHPFLLFWPKNAHLPESFLPVFIFHRQHGNILTHCLTSLDSLNYQASGLYIADPDLIQQIPAGIVSLRQTVFPNLIKNNKVRAYVS